MKIIKTQLAFVAHYMQPIYDLIASFQKQTGGPANPLKCWDDIKKNLGAAAGGKFDRPVQRLLDSLSAAQARTVAAQLQEASQMMCNKVDNLYKKTIKSQAKTQKAIDCFNPDALQTPAMLSHSEVSKEIPEIPRTEWERYIVLPAPSPLPETTSARVAWWEVKAADFPILSSIAVFFVRRPRSACHVERAFSLLGHIVTHDRRNMSNETLRHLAIMYVNKMDKKRKSEEED